MSLKITKKKGNLWQGTAEMVFARREDAVSAVNRYSNVQLDGKPLKIEIVGTNIAMSLLENLTVPINYTKRIVEEKLQKRKKSTSEVHAHLLEY
ncbi:THO complex [Salix suchowensis]|nr:THO complex [Salix suchowensis]